MNLNFRMLENLVYGLYLVGKLINTNENKKVIA